MLEPHCSSVISSGQTLPRAWSPWATDSNSTSALINPCGDKGLAWPWQAPLRQVHCPGGISRWGGALPTSARRVAGFPDHNKRNGGSSAWQKAAQLQEELPTQGNKNYFEILFPSLTGVYVGVGGI